MAIDLDIAMSPLEAAIWSFLIGHCAGPEKAMHRAAIISRFNLINPTREIHDRLFRQVVSDLVITYKKAICTTPADGYYVARTMRELEGGIRALEAKGATIFQRARALKETLPLEKQERLF